MKLWLWIVLALPVALIAGDTPRRFSTVFFGLARDDAPALAATYDELVRSRLVSSEALTAVDQLTSHDFQQRTSFDYSREISRDMVTALQRHFGDSTLVSWARIRNYSVVPVRRHLLGCAVRGTAQLEITMVLLEQQGRALRAELNVEVSQSKGLLFFSVNKVHVTAAERAAVTSALADAAAMRTIDMLESVVQGVVSARAVEVPPQQVEEESQQLRSLVSIPIAEQPTLRRATPPPDSLSNPAPAPAVSK